MNLILPESVCEQGLNQLDVLLATHVNAEDPEAVARMISSLSSIQGYSAKIMASCEYHKLVAPSPLTKAMYTLSERMNSSVGKALLGYQSILSKLREEIKTTKYQ